MYILSSNLRINRNAIPFAQQQYHENTRKWYWKIFFSIVIIIEV